MRRFAVAQMTPEEKKAALEAKLAEKKAELAQKKSAQEDELKRTMLQMKKDGKTVDEIKAYMLEQKKKIAMGDQANFLPISEIRKRPAHLDQSKLESYLSDAEFKSLFSMTKAEFEKAPKWKKDSLKKEQQIF